MTYAPHHKDFVRYIGDASLSGSCAVSKKIGVLRRIIIAIDGWRRRQSEREMGCFIERSGGRFTDDLERRMMRRMSTWDRNARD